MRFVDGLFCYRYPFAAGLERSFALPLVEDFFYVRCESGVDFMGRGVVGGMISTRRLSRNF